MATYLKYVMDMYFEELWTENKYDKFLLQQLWDESNTVVKNMLYNYVETKYPAINDEKTNAKICGHEMKKKGEIIKCTNKVAGPNRKTCYRHTPELQTIIKKKHVHPQPEPEPEPTKIQLTCTFVPQKGKFKGTVCGVEIEKGELCSKHNTE
jgi:hypothetical protein